MLISAGPVRKPGSPHSFSLETCAQPCPSPPPAGPLWHCGEGHLGTVNRMRLSRSHSRDSGFISRSRSLRCGGSLEGRHRRLWGPGKVMGRHLLLTLRNCFLLCQIFRSVIFWRQIQNSQSCRAWSPAPLGEKTGAGQQGQPRSQPPSSPRPPRTLSCAPGGRWPACFPLRWELLRGCSFSPVGFQGWLWVA